MESRAIDDFVKLVSSSDVVKQSSELKSALDGLQGVVNSDERNLKVTDNTEIAEQLLEFEKQMDEMEEQYNEDEKNFDLKIARIDAAIEKLKESVAQAFRSGELQEFKDFVIYTELGIEINQTQLDLAEDVADETCCEKLLSICHPPKKVTKAKTDEAVLKKQQSEVKLDRGNPAREKYVNDMNRHIIRLQNAKEQLLKSPPQTRIEQLKIELEKAEKAMAQHRRKQLDSVSENTMRLVVKVYKLYTAALKESGQTQNSLMFLMDKMTCRDMNFVTAWYWCASGTPRGGMFQGKVVEEAKAEVKLDVKKGLVV